MVIRLTNLGGGRLVLNCDLIERIESVPETVITLTNGKKLLVGETVDEVVNLVVAYRQRLLQGIPEIGKERHGDQ